MTQLQSENGLWRGCLATSLVCAALLAPPSADAATPVKLALFEFELEDFSAGATTPIAPADAKLMGSLTGEIGALLAQSGRYSLVDVAGADADAARTHMLHACDGCDAPIALELGAAQSFVGVVKRISRMEYTVRFQLRDAKTGAVLSDADSGLRMGADYSWDRGAVQLVKEKLLAAPQ